MRLGFCWRRWSQADWACRFVLAGFVWAVLAFGIALGQDEPRSAATGAIQAATAGKVSYERILGAAREPSNWLTYSGRYSGWRYSTLEQINADNVSRLRMEWAFQVGDLGQFETTPLVVDGILYGTGQNNRAFALDARTGRAIWRYQRNLPGKLQPCCGMVNRGFAMLGDRLFMATLDAHVVALDAKTGNVVWDVEAADAKLAYTFTVAPLAVKNEIIVGVSGGEYGVRGFVDAYVMFQTLETVADKALKGEFQTSCSA